MDVVELKNKIENNSLGDSVLIFKYSDSPFLCKHYIKHIAQNKGREIRYVSSLDADDDDSLFEFDDNSLRVLSVENLQFQVSPEEKNLIIICRDLDKNIKVDYIDIPKLVNWQIEAFVKSRLTGLTDEQVKWLCENSKYDVYRLDNECRKLEDFSPAMQELIFKEQINENVFCDLNSLNIFNLTEAIFKKDLDMVKTILINRDYIDLEPAGIVTLLLRNYYKLLITLSSNYWSESISNIISEKQYRYFKAVYAKMYSVSSILNIYELLTSMDYKLKSGKIDYDKIIDYLIVNLLGD